MRNILTSATEKKKKKKFSAQPFTFFSPYFEVAKGCGTELQEAFCYTEGQTGIIKGIIETLNQ